MSFLFYCYCTKHPEEILKIKKKNLFVCFCIFLCNKSIGLDPTYVHTILMVLVPSLMQEITKKISQTPCWCSCTLKEISVKWMYSFRLNQLDFIPTIQITYDILLPYFLYWNPVKYLSYVWELQPQNTFLYLSNKQKWSLKINVQIKRDFKYLSYVWELQRLNYIF